MNQARQINLSEFDMSKLDLDKTLEEVEKLKKDIDNVRYEINSFLTLLANVPESRNQSEFYHKVSFKLFQLRDELSKYLDKYNKLLPVIDLAHQSNGFKAQKFEIVNLEKLKHTGRYVTAKGNSNNTGAGTAGANTHNSNINGNNSKNNNNNNFGSNMQNNGSNGANMNNFNHINKQDLSNLKMMNKNVGNGLMMNGANQSQYIVS